MTTLPADTFWDTSKTEGEASAGWFYKCLDVWKEMPGGAETVTELTISSGSITPLYAAHTVDTEGDAASDDLANIAVTNHPESRRLLIRAENAARTVVLKHEAGGSGQISLVDGVDFSLDDADKWIELVLIGTTWEEVTRTNLNSKQDTITGAATTITSSDLTASKALVSNGSGKVAVSATTSTELGYLNGTTSAVQTQINTKITGDIRQKIHAWVNFSASGGTVVVTGSYNISSVVRNSTGDFTINYPAANYAGIAVGIARVSTVPLAVVPFSITTSVCSITTNSTATGTVGDPDTCYVAIVSG